MPIIINVDCPKCKGQQLIGGTPNSPGVPCDNCNATGSIPKEAPKAHVQVNVGYKFATGTPPNVVIHRFPEEFDVDTQTAVNAHPALRILETEYAEVVVQQGLSGQSPGKPNWVDNATPPSKRVIVKVGKKPRGRPKKVKKPSFDVAPTQPLKPQTPPNPQNPQPASGS